MANPTIRFKRGTQSAFGSVGLNTGEPAFITDEQNFYIGSDGSSGNNRFFGSSRYWVKENATNSLQVVLVNKDGSTSNSIRLKSPDAHTGITTYTLPSTPVNSYVLTTNADGDLSWTNIIPGGTFTGITTFTDTTDNTLGDENTGSVQLDGGMGIAKNLTVKQNLHVGGYSEFVGVVTFRGGTINLGDGDTDDIVVAGEFASSLVPTTDATYDIGGDSSKQWRHANFSGIGTFDGGLDVGGEAVFASATVEDLTSGRVVLAGSGGSLVDDASLTYSDVSGLVVANSGINVTGVSTFSTDLVVGGDITITGNDIRSSTGNSAITLNDTAVTINGDLYVSGSTTQVNTTTLTVEDNLIELAKVDGSAPGSDVNKDVGLLLHYYDTAARLGAVYWDDSASRIVLASRVGESSGVLTVDSGYYADVEFQGLYVTDTAGSGEAVVSYATIGGVTGRHLQNIIVDGGTF